MMAIFRSKYRYIASAIGIYAILLVYYITVISTLDRHAVEKHQMFKDATANVVIPALFDSRNETFDCKTTHFMKMTFPICHYSSHTDGIITNRILRGGYYEAAYVRRILRLLYGDQRLQLVDIGANIGVFSLPAARVAQVLAVEPYWRSMSRLAKAVDLALVSSNITLVHNAVSDVRAIYSMVVDPHNQGRTFMRRCKTSCKTSSPIKTILLNDLLPLMRSRAALLKVDVEGYEVNVFTDLSAGEFFKKIHIPFVLMEWSLCRKHPNVQRLLDFFYNRNYTIFNVNRNHALDKQHPVAE